MAIIVRFKFHKSNSVRQNIEIIKRSFPVVFVSFIMADDGFN